MDFEAFLDLHSDDNAELVWKTVLTDQHEGMIPDGVKHPTLILLRVFKAYILMHICLIFSNHHRNVF